MEMIRVGERVLLIDAFVEGEAIQLDEVADRDLSGLAAVAVLDEAAQDLAEPGADSLRVAQRRERPEGLHVGLLDQVLGVLGGSA
jgi:hypothetical protein